MSHSAARVRLRVMDVLLGLIALLVAGAIMAIPFLLYRSARDR